MTHMFNMKPSYDAYYTNHAADEEPLMHVVRTVDLFRTLPGAPKLPLNEDGLVDWETLFANPGWLYCENVVDIQEEAAK